MQRVFDELRKLLGKRLHIGVRDHRRCVMKVGGEHERVSGGGIDAVRSPGAAHGCVAKRVVSGIMRYGNHELALLFGKLLEELLLQELEIDDGERRAGLLRREDVAVANGDDDLQCLHFRLAE